MAKVQKSTDSSSLAEVVDRILDKGIVIDAWVRVSLVGFELLSIEARVVIASVETYLKYAEAIGLVDVFEADEQLAAEALSTAIRYKHSVYDMLYVILARRHGCSILTVDKKLITLTRQLDKSILP